MVPSFQKLLNTARELKWDLQHRLRDYFVDKRLGIHTGGKFFIQFELSESGDAVGYSATRYKELETVIDSLQLKTEDIFIDFGCGKGRMVFFVATHKIKKVIGLEIDPSLMRIARNNLKRVKIKNSPVELHEGDAVNFNIKDGTIFYFYNPFGLKTMMRIIDNIKGSVTDLPRRIRLVYKNPVCRTYLDSLDWLMFKKQIPGTETFVWENKF